MAEMVNQIPQSIVEQAIAWHLKISASQRKASVNAKFEGWLAQDALHAEAYQRVNHIFQPIEYIDVKAAGKSIVSVLQADHRVGIGKNLRGIALGLTLFVSMGLGLQMQPVKIMLADNKTAIGEIKTLTLPDNSSIIMNTNTAFDVQFDEHQRIIKLYKGEVFVEVSKDASRPFVVVTEHGDARALGTQFNVIIKPDLTHVGVVESKVEACHSPSYFNDKIRNLNHRHCIALQPNQGVNISNQSLGEVQEIDANAIAGWVSGAISFDNQPLTDVLAELQRYSPEKIVFSPAELHHIKVSGVLPVNNIPHAFTILAEQFKLQIKQVDSNIIKINTQE